ncbi:MAG: hypothetical protein WCY89_07030 [Flavobacteriaceae bacterium]
MNKNIFNAILIGCLIIIICNILGHYVPPFSLFTCWIYMNIIIGVIHLPLYKVSFKLTSAYNFFLLLINDLLIRNYAGGEHDSAGKGWCLLMFVFTLFIASVVMIVYFKKELSIKSNMLVMIVGVLITSIIYWFYNLHI